MTSTPRCAKKLAMIDRCNATIEGPIAKGTRNAPTWRKQCKARKMRGYNHCQHHLSDDEKQRRRLS